MSSYPSSIASLTNPNPTDLMNNPSHSTIEGNQNNEIIAIETYVGTSSSADTNSLTYKVSNKALSQLSDVSISSPTNGQALTYSSVLGKWQNSAAVAKFGGTGADGALSITTGTTTISLGGAAVFVKNYSSLSITGTGQLSFSNPHANGTFIILKVSGGITISTSGNPAIDASGMGATGGTAGVVPGGNGGTGNQAQSSIGLLYGGGAGSLGTGAATNTAGAAGGTLLGKLIFLTKVINVVPGSGGGGTGATGGFNATTGGGGGGSSANTTGSIGSTGSGGAGTNIAGFAGGNGGAALYIECAGTYNCSAVISVAGKNGTNSTTDGGGGGGGGGGTILALYNTLGADTGTYTVSGGTGGTAVRSNTGGNGAAGQSYVGVNTEFA